MSRKTYAVENVKSIKPFANGKSYFRFASRATALARDEAFICWLLDHGVKAFIDVPNKGVNDYYLEEPSMLGFSKRQVKKVLSEWGAHLKRYPTKKARVIAAAKELSKELGTKALQRYKEYLDALYDFCEFIWTPWAIIYALEEEVLKAFPDDAEAIMGLAKPIEYMKLQRDVHKMNVEEWLETYAWGKVYNPSDPPYDENDYEKLKRETYPPRIEQEFKSIEENEKKFAKFIETITDPELRRKAEALHTYTFLRTDRIDTWKQGMYYARPFFEHLAQLGGFTIKESDNLAAAEAITLLSTGKAPPLGEMRLRSSRHTLYHFEAEMIKVLNDQARIEELKERLIGEAAKLKVLKGHGAGSGTARGKAVVINSEEDLQKMEKGKIFVAKFTFPRFTPYMLKAAAIVTDEGGVISHAAITAREHGIPCVVGTTHGTEAIKDGDLVEVDAEKGIVRKVE